MNKKNLALVVFTCSAVAIASAAPLQIDTQKTKIEVEVHPTGHAFTGKLQNYLAVIDCDSQAALPSHADVSFDFKDLKTGDDGRDRDMLKWLEYSNYPSASFHLTGWKQEGTNNYALGDFVLHGVTNSIQMPATVTHTGPAWEIDGEATIEYTDYKLPHIRKALVFSVSPKLKVTYQVFGWLSPTK